MNQHLESIGPYKLLSELGRGAMAHVWRAWDPNLEREVAVKIPNFGQDLSDAAREEMSRRFVAEGRAAARLSHPGIVTVYAADVWDGVAAIVMELVEGSTLSDLLSAGPLSPSMALRILDQLLDAVGYAHARGVVHRDIKPDNIFVSTTGSVKLADFGIAHIDNAVETHATMAGAVLGTPGYMSPEQALGRPVDARSDLFSVGVIAHEMLTGSNPFGASYDADPVTLIYRIIHEPAPELPDSVAEALPIDIRPAIMAALSKNPEERPATAGDFKLMLHGQIAPATIQSYETIASEVPANIFAPSQDTMAPSPVATAVETRQGGKRPSWLPYALVGGVCAIGLAIALGSALGGKGGGGHSVENPVAYYLSVYDGNVAIYTSASAEPHEVSDVAVSELSPDEAAQLGGRIPVASLDEAEARIQQYREAAESTEVAPVEAEEEVPAPTPTPAEAFPTDWSGSFKGRSSTGAMVDKDLRMTFDHVGEDGYVTGICIVGAEETDPNEGTGSYYFEGTIDWTTNKIELFGTEWANQGGLTLMRNYSGTFDSTRGTINGTCELRKGTSGSVWKMKAN